MARLYKALQGCVSLYAALRHTPYDDWLGFIKLMSTAYLVFLGDLSGVIQRSMSLWGPQGAPRAPRGPPEHPLGHPDVTGGLILFPGNLCCSKHFTA